MITATIDPDFSSWREKARALIASGTEPSEVLWLDGSEDVVDLFGGKDCQVPPTSGAPAFKVPLAFVNLAELVACYRDPSRWGRLYRVLWRLTRGGERHLLRQATDDDVHDLEKMAKDVRRDRHKMTAFVRFRKVGEHAETGREQFVAWFEPSHLIVDLVGPFFAKRFAGMDWSILTPDKCLHWDGNRLQTTPGVSKAEAPDADALDDLWRGYYKSIFNPARLKVQAMQAEMPKKYWKNLPEAPLIEELIRSAKPTTASMLGRETTAPRKRPRNVYLERLHELKDEAWHDSIPQDLPERPLSEIRDLASRCRACHLCQSATQTVFGQGPDDAEVMLIGEQPGDEEDLRGQPFIGPAGQLLDQVLKEIGVAREQLYITNTVKHFKWRPQGKRRLHQTPNAGEVTACSPWLIAEVLRVRPKTIVCLGATAARAIFGGDFRLMQQRGQVIESTRWAERVIATVHPSYLLRLRDPQEAEQERSRWKADLQLAMG